MLYYREFKSISAPWRALEVTLFQQVPSYMTAFAAGVISFLTPCVLPLVPGYISFISGVSLTELQGGDGDEEKSRTLPLMITIMAFVIGFSIIFIITGLTAFALGQALRDYKDWLIRIAGVVIIVLGLHMAGLFRIKSLYQEKRFQGGAGGSAPRAFLLGLAFAFGWTPCVGPILGGILGLAAKQEHLGQALILMLLYSAGMAIPFVITGLAVDTFLKAFDRIKNHFRKIEIGAGVLLVMIGLAMVINHFKYVKVFFQLILPDKLSEWG